MSRSACLPIRHFAFGHLTGKYLNDLERSGAPDQWPALASVTPRPNVVAAAVAPMPNWQKIRHDVDADGARLRPLALVRRQHHHWRLVTDPTAGNPAGNLDTDSGRTGGRDRRHPPALHQPGPMMESLFPAGRRAGTPDISNKLTLTALADDWKAGRLDWRDPTPKNWVRPPGQAGTGAAQAGSATQPGDEEGRRACCTPSSISIFGHQSGTRPCRPLPGLPSSITPTGSASPPRRPITSRILRERLNSLGYDYGDFPAHAGLWEMAMKTADDPLARMAWFRACSKRAGWMPRHPSSAAGTGRRRRQRPRAGHHPARRDRLRRPRRPLVSPSLRGAQPGAGKHLSRPAARLQGTRPITPMNEAARLAAGFRCRNWRPLRKSAE